MEPGKETAPDNAIQPEESDAAAKPAAEPPVQRETGVDPTEEHNNVGDSTQRQMHRYATMRPAEVEAGPADADDYKEFRSVTDLREPYRIDLKFLEGTKKYTPPDLAEAPLIVFINSRSGGRSGPTLTEQLFHALGHTQVFDLQESSPGPVLRQIWENFEKAKRDGDPTAAIVQRRVRVLAAGGDGTVAWILGTIHALKLDPPPPVAVMPLGTGNDLSLSFGWGNTFLQAWIKSYRKLYGTLQRIAQAELRDLDIWKLSFTAGDHKLFSSLPHSLAAKKAKGTALVEGLFWNYFSVGLDAASAYGFHHLRETKPWMASSRAANKFWYGFFSLTTGWCCGAPPISNQLKLTCLDENGQWKEVRIPKSVKAVVILNLQSYGGGNDLWGLSADSKRDNADWRTPIFNDGMFEAVGLQSLAHTAVVMAGVHKGVHALRLAQSRGMSLELSTKGLESGATGLTHLQVDGEPWAQKVPSAADQPLKVTITHAGHSKMLFNTKTLKGMPRKITKLAEREARVSQDPIAHQKGQMVEMLAQKGDK